MTESEDKKFIEEVKNLGHIYEDDSIYFYAKDKKDFVEKLEKLDRGVCTPYGNFDGAGIYSMQLISCPKCGSPVEDVYYLGE